MKKIPCKNQYEPVRTVLNGMARNTQPVTISLDPGLLASAKRKSKKLQRTFSNYIAFLITQDAETLKAEALKKAEAK